MKVNELEIYQNKLKDIMKQINIYNDSLRKLQAESYRIDGIITYIKSKEGIDKKKNK